MEQQHEEHELKELNEQQLLERVLAAGEEEWTEDEQAMVVGAYDMARTIHHGDTHRDKPYVYHLLRNTARITEYFHITDPHIAAGMLLHDGVEDHAGKIVEYFYRVLEAEQPTIPDDLLELRAQALDCIALLVSPRAARMVAGLTNSLEDTSGLTREEKAQHYVDHVAEAIEEIDVFWGKLSDWGDNGLGIVHSDFPDGSPRLAHFEYKYGLLAPVLEARFYRDDVQAMLDPTARANIERMFQLARERLTVES